MIHYRIKLCIFRRINQVWRKKWSFPIIGNIAFFKLHLLLPFGDLGPIGRAEHLKSHTRPWSLMLFELCAESISNQYFKGLYEGASIFDLLQEKSQNVLTDAVCFAIRKHVSRCEICFHGAGSYHFPMHNLIKRRGSYEEGMHGSGAGAGGCGL